MKEKSFSARCNERDIGTAFNFLSDLLAINKTKKYYSVFVIYRNSSLWALQANA